MPRLLLFLLGILLPLTARAQLPPAMGYMYPPGGQAGTSVEVVLGGYDWTPDMQLFVHDPRIKLEILAAPGPVIVPEPPYWFGKKARRPPFLLPRETRARLTIPNGVEPGVVRWQAANANGATATGRLLVGDTPGLIEIDGRDEPQQLAALPATVSGQIKKIEEVDRYRFTAAASGPVTCAVVARAIGSPLNAVLEVRDDDGHLVADAADTAGVDTALTFAADAGRSYTAEIYDVDFRGNRAFVYQLTITPGPRVVAAIPAAGRRGETRAVELVGYGVETGTAVLESTTRDITFPTDPHLASIDYRLETSHGAAPPFTLLVSDLPETTELAGASSALSVPAAVTGVLEERFGEDRYRLSGTKGETWKIELMAERIGSPLDVSLAILNSDGKELARNDDVPGSTDAALEFTVGADGDYEIVVADAAGQSGTPAAVYRLTVQTAEPSFTLGAPEMLDAPLGGAAKLALTATRTAGFQDPIAISLTGLPPGVSVPDDLQIAAKQKALNVELTVAADAPAGASLVTVIGEATVGEQTIRRSAGPVLIATTIKPPFAIDAEGKDDVTKWPRGSTFPAPVLIERDEGFNDEIVLEMHSKQGRTRQGITGPELTVPPGVQRILYPVFLPEWLETTRTSRMVVNGVAKVADPQGNVRYSVSKQKTRMGFLPTGALLKIATDAGDFQVVPGETVAIPLIIHRASDLTEPVRIELTPVDGRPLPFHAEPVICPAGRAQATFVIAADSTVAAGAEYTLRMRATALQNGDLPVVSQADITVRATTSSDLQ